MTDDTKRLAEIREREAKATPGPWITSDDGEDTVRVCAAPDGACVCCLALIGQTNHDGQWTDTTKLAWSSDAAFVAHARSDIPWLLAQLAARDRKIAELEGALEKAKLRFGLLALKRNRNDVDPAVGVEEIDAALRDEEKGEGR